MPDYVIKIRVPKKDMTAWAESLVQELDDMISQELDDQTGVDCHEMEELKVMQVVEADLKRVVAAEVPKIVESAIRKIKSEIMREGLDEAMYNSELYDWIDKPVLRKLVKASVAKIVADPDFDALAEKHKDSVRAMKLAQLENLAKNLGVKIQIPDE